MRITAIFLDDGGVMNDNTLRGAEWQRLVGEFLSPRLGGAPEAWAEANQAVFERQWRRFEAWLAARDGEYGDFFDAPEERERWLRELCEHVGVPAPTFDDCVDLARETERYVVPRVRAAFPGAAEAVRELSRRGRRLYTASGTTSWLLHENLTGVGVRQLFPELLYGPDLVQALKAGPTYYERIFRDAGVDPRDALVVDDTPAAVAWAADAGARTALVQTTSPSSKGADLVVPSLAELLAALEARRTIP